MNLSYMKKIVMCLKITPRSINFQIQIKSSCTEPKNALVASIDNSQPLK